MLSSKKSSLSGSSISKVLIMTLAIHIYYALVKDQNKDTFDGQKLTETLSNVT